MSQDQFDDVLQFIDTVEKKGLDIPIVIEVHINIGDPSTGGDGDDDDGGTLKPNTIIVEMIVKEAYKFTKSNNSSGVPIMQGLEIGFNAVEGQRLEVYFPAIVADGGTKYYRVWNDGIIGEIWNGMPVKESKVPVYVEKSRTIRIN